LQQSVQLPDSWDVPLDHVPQRHSPAESPILAWHLDPSISLFPIKQDVECLIDANDVDDSQQPILVENSPFLPRLQLLVATAGDSAKQ
jgi:hypothetical protein